MDGKNRVSTTRHLAVVWILLAAAILLSATPVAARDPLDFSRVDGLTAEEATQNFEGDASTHSHLVEGVLALGVDPVGSFTSGSVTFDCATCYLGFGASRWDFTVTVPTDITVEVNDCCIEGDRYEARCNDRNVDEDGDGDLNNHEEDCIFGREDVNVPVGTFANLGTVTLDPGDWTVRIRDIQFQCGTVNPGCPAGYTMRITFGSPTDTPCACLPSCFETFNGVGVGPGCADESVCRDEFDPIEAKLDVLEPQIITLEQKLDQMQIQLDLIVQLLDTIEAKLDGGGTPCDLSDPTTCGGDCPTADEVCTIDPLGGPCTCITPCSLSDPLTCDGDCPIAGEICTLSTLVPPGPCTCEPPVPCDVSDPATCDGICPNPTDVCTLDAIGQCFCAEGFCDEPGAPCTPCQLGTVCFDGTPCGALPSCP